MPRLSRKYDDYLLYAYFIGSPDERNMTVTLAQTAAQGAQLLERKVGRKCSPAAFLPLQESIQLIQQLRQANQPIVLPPGLK